MQRTGHSSNLPQHIINVPGTGSATPPSGSDSQNSVGGDLPEVDLKKDPYAAQQELGAKSAKGERCAVTVEAATTATAVDAFQTTHCIAQVKVIADEGFNAEQFADGLANNDSVLALSLQDVSSDGMGVIFGALQARKSSTPVTLTLVGCGAANPGALGGLLCSGRVGELRYCGDLNGFSELLDVVHGYSRDIGRLKLHLTSSEPLESCTSLVKELVAFKSLDLTKRTSIEVSIPQDLSVVVEYDGSVPAELVQIDLSNPVAEQQLPKMSASGLRYAVKALGAHVAPQLIQALEDPECCIEHLTVKGGNFPHPSFATMLNTNQSLKGLSIWNLQEDHAFPPVFSELASRTSEKRPIALKLVAVEPLDLDLDNLIRSRRLSELAFHGSKVDIGHVLDVVANCGGGGLKKLHLTLLPNDKSRRGPRDIPLQILGARASKVLHSKIIEEITLPTELLEIDKQIFSVEEPLIEITLKAENAVQMLGEMELGGGRYAVQLQIDGATTNELWEALQKTSCIFDLTVIAEEGFDGRKFANCLMQINSLEKLELRQVKRNDFKLICNVLAQQGDKLTILTLIHCYPSEPDMKLLLGAKLRTLKLVAFRQYLAVVLDLFTHMNMNDVYLNELHFTVSGNHPGLAEITLDVFNELAENLRTLGGPKLIFEEMAGDSDSSEYDSSSGDTQNSISSDEVSTSDDE